MEREGESHQDTWRKHWEERGFSSWGEWRSDYIQPIQPEDRQWYLYKIQKPYACVREFYGVPSRGWIQKCYNGQITKKIGDILPHPTIRDNNKIQSIIKNYPKKVMFVGIVHEGKIVLVEGMHRGCALTRMDEKSLDNHMVTIALAEFEGEIPRLGKGDNF